MSSHYISISCTTPSCTSYEQIYTGDVVTDLFESAGPDSWEGEYISVRCINCIGEDIEEVPRPNRSIYLSATSLREAYTALSAMERDTAVLSHLDPLTTVLLPLNGSSTYEVVDKTSNHGLTEEEFNAHMASKYYPSPVQVPSDVLSDLVSGKISQTD